MDRRDFLRSSFAAGSLAVLGTGIAPAAWAAASPRSPQDPQHINRSVILMGDDVPITAATCWRGWTPSCRPATRPAISI